ncbi:P-loop containing nucleoside triphosphate hydrolase protein [Mycena latifolia]|nr:P-loop containing nucleoside triphosphate hydrolase protein [Mycena latifolia]
MKLSSTADAISGYRMRIQELRLNFLVMATIDTNLQVHKGFAAAKQLNPLGIQIMQSRTRCPPPSRIFHGRQQILDKMHEFFEQDLSQQHIFLLHGLGGAGKTQIALKFIQESSSHFSEIFLIDTSTPKTIETGLKNIAATKNAGGMAQDALEWLRSQSDEWLLLFDNADDPKINLHKFFPHCSHGNILITSRNPGLQVYAGSQALVSDMEEGDAVELLLKSAATATTPANKDTATEIVKELCYLPLAIIQAGAFISQSGALDRYLELYMDNRARLLSEKPVQSHDDYAWTVYTTWQISFDQLSKLAATFLQLCSFLHHEGISEEIFSRASAYDFPAHDPSKEELEEPLEFLSQFLGPAGTWDSLHFMQVTNELRAYSLITLHLEKNIFSIHPLVHSWSQSTLTDRQSYHYWAVAVLGMSIARLLCENVQLASLEVLPHLDSLIGAQGGTNLTPDFRSDYAWIYLWAGRCQDAHGLYLGVLADRRNLLGEDHPHTLSDMVRVAVTHQQLGESKEAEELCIVALAKMRKILGEDNPETLNVMAILGSIYHNLGRSKEAEELEVVVLEKRRKILGEDHRDTLVAMAHLGSTYHNLGQLKKAEELYIGVLEKMRKILGEAHPDTLFAMGNLGSTYHTLGQFKMAEELQVVVLEKRRKIFGDAHPDTLIAMADLGSTFHNLNQLKKAEELEVVVLEKWRKILGEDHPDTLHAMHNLAATYYYQNQFTKAEQLYIELLAKQTNILGDDHSHTLNTAKNLADTQQAMAHSAE